MNNTELILYQQNLPDTIENVAQFLLVAPEKAKALKAEIQAIKKLNLAQEVYDQKKEEERMLAELILDASVRLGELTSIMPTAPGARIDLQPSNSGSIRLCTKKEAISKLGLTKNQTHSFETLAKNKDIVEQVKEESREKGVIPTRTQVLELAKAKRQENQLTKKCRDCGEEKLASEFYDRKPNCKKCYNSTKSYKDVKGGDISSNPEVDRLFKEKGGELIKSLEANSDIEYTIDDLVEELRSIIGWFGRNANDRLSRNMELVRASKEKIKTALLEAEAAIEKMREEYLL